MTEPQKRPNDGMVPLIALLIVVGVALLAWWPIILIAHQHGERVPDIG